MIYLWEKWSHFAQLSPETYPQEFSQPPIICSHMFFLWSTGTHGSHLSSFFKLLRDGPQSGGSNDHPNVSKHFKEFFYHPFIDCMISNVPVRAHIDTGSLKSFLNVNIRRTIDFEENTFDRNNAHPCVSITGDNLLVLGKLISNVRFLKSKLEYLCSFLVIDNIQCQ